MASPAVNETNFATFVTSEAIGPHIRVLLEAAGTIAIAGLTDIGIGYLTERSAASGDATTVRLNSAPEHVGIANAALEVGDVLFSAAAGEVDDTDGGSAVRVGVCTGAAAAALERVTFMPITETLS